MKRCPRGVLGAIFGSLGCLPLMPIAAGIARRLSSVPVLPGAEHAAGDFKSATYAEAAVLLAVVPLAALFFGELLPRFLESQAGGGALSFEWAGVAFASSFFLAQSGVAPGRALAAGSVAAAATAAGVLRFRRSLRVRRLFGRRGRRAATRLFLAASSLELARRAGLAAPPLAPVHVAWSLLLAGGAVFGVTALLCLGFSRRPVATFSRVAGIAWILVAAAAAALAWPQASPLILTAGIVLAALAFILFRAPVSPSFGRWSLVALCLVCAWRVVDPGVFRIEFLEDGVSLFGTQAYSHGARPYVDMVPVHGWGADGGVDSTWFRIFGNSLRAYFLRQSSWAAAALVCLAGACVAALGPFWGAVGLLLCLSIQPVALERQMLALAALLLLCRGSRHRSRPALAAAGAFAGWEVLYSLDYGVFVAAGGLVALALLPVLQRRSPDRDSAGRRSGVGPFAAGLVLGTLPFLIVLAFEGSLEGFLRTSFVEVPRWVDQVWGIPIAGFWQALVSARSVGGLASLFSGQALAPLFLLVLLGAAGGVLLLRSAAGAFDADDRGAWIVFVVAALSMRAVLGRADSFHYARYGMLAGVPAAWLLMRAWRGSRAGELLFLPALLLILARLHPLATLEFELQALEGPGRLAERAPVVPAPRSGGVRMDAEQAGALTWFRRFVDTRLRPDESFFDFNNSPALYYVTDRRPPIRYCSVAQYESAQRQQEVIAALEKSQPPLAVLPSGPFEKFDGVSNAERAPGVFRYLQENYEPDPEVSWMAWRKGTPGRGPVTP